jgi:hypothetical protein
VLTEYGAVFMLSNNSTRVSLSLITSYRFDKTHVNQVK